MQYKDSIGESQEYLRLALVQLGNHGLPTNPVNYSVWYEYASGRNSNLRAAIDRAMEDNITVSNDICRQLYTRYIIKEREKVISLVRRELKGILTDIIGTTQTTRQYFYQSGNKLHSIGNAMIPDLSKNEMKELIRQIKFEVQNLELSSGSFRDQLEQATNEIKQLKIKMQQYQKQAFMDQLTHLENRRGFEENIVRAIDNADQTGTDLCLIMADLDHFKKINDTHGHLVGDNVLRMAAATLRESIKGKDCAARIGGEEFAVILPETPIDGAVKLADNIRRAFEGLNLKKKHTGESLGRVTISLGVAIYRQGESCEDFIRRTDEALYQSKNTGRNKVTGIKT